MYSSVKFCLFLSIFVFGAVANGQSVSIKKDSPRKDIQPYTVSVAKKKGKTVVVSLRYLTARPETFARFLKNRKTKGKVSPVNNLIDDQKKLLAMLDSLPGNTAIEMQNDSVIQNQTLLVKNSEIRSLLQTLKGNTRSNIVFLQKMTILDGEKGRIEDRSKKKYLADVQFQLDAEGNAFVNRIQKKYSEGTIAQAKVNVEEQEVSLDLALIFSGTESLSKLTKRLTNPLTGKSHAFTIVRPQTNTRIVKVSGCKIPKDELLLIGPIRRTELKENRGHSLLGGKTTEITPMFHYLVVECKVVE